VVTSVVGIGALVAGCCFPPGGGGAPPTTSTSSSSSSTTLGPAVLTVDVPDIYLVCDSIACQGDAVITVTNTGAGPTTVAPVLSGPFGIFQGSCAAGVLPAGGTCTGSVSVATLSAPPITVNGSVTATAGSVTASDDYIATT
jgi:hypothetical protein